MQATYLLAAIAALQVLWLATIWLTGIAFHTEKILPLLVYSVACSLGVSYLPAGCVSKLRRLIERLVRNEQFLSWSLGASVILVGAVYAYVQLGWPDEMYAFAASRTVAEQGVRSFFADYTRIWWLGTQHPPLVPLMYGFAMRVFGVHLFVIRLVSLLLSLATLLLTYRLGCTLYDRDTGLRAALLFLATPFFLRIGATALIDMPVTFFFVLTLYFTVRLLQAPTYRFAVVAGLCLGAGLLCKYTMVFIYPLLLGVFIIQGSLRRSMPYLGIVILVSGGVLSAWLGYAASLGVLTVQRDTLASYTRFFALSTSDGMRWKFGALFFGLPSGLGTYTLPMLLLGGWQLVQRRSQADLWVLLWIVAVFLPLILTLPRPRYFLPAFPALALAMACGLGRLDETVERVVIAALLYCGGALYLFIDWYRQVHSLFV